MSGSNGATPKPRLTGATMAFLSMTRFKAFRDSFAVERFDDRED